MKPSSKSNLIPISSDDLTEIKKSSAHARDFFTRRKILGWPRIITIEGNHFIEKIN